MVVLFLLQRAEELHQPAVEHNQSRSTNQAMVSAMIEAARSSTWQENLENVAEAQDRFMFGSNGAPQGLMKRPTVRIDELMRIKEAEPQYWVGRC